jgi:hypothetical protein
MTGQPKRALRSIASQRPRARATLMTAVLFILATPASLQAQVFDPFGEPETSRPPPVRRATPSENDRAYLPPPFDDSQRGGAAADGVTREALPPSAALQERSNGVMREELAPVMATDGSGLPYDLWNGLSPEQLAEAIAALDLPPRSPTLNALWRRLITAQSSPEEASGGPARLTALRVEALDQSGLIDEEAALLAKNPATSGDPVLGVLLARSEIGLGNTERGCQIGRDLRAEQTKLPKPMQADAILINGYCAAVQGDTAGAELQAGLLRELDAGDTLGADLLDAAATGIAAQIPTGSKLSLLDYRIAEIKGGLQPAQLVAAATPALLAALARDPKAAPDLMLAAGEAAAAINALPAQDLARLYRAPGAGGDGGSIERAGLFKQAEAEQTPLRKARLIRAFLDESRRAKLYWPALQLMAAPTAALAPVPEIGWFAETAIEVCLASGNFEGVRSWIAFGASLDSSNPGAPDPLAHWAALADLADPSLASGHERNLGAVEKLALTGGFDPAVLHRLATALDALDINVPIPLWDLASRSPQPSTGHLPETGVLSELKDASQKKQFGRTVLLAMRTIGPNTAEGAHMIALGDAIRALKRAGLGAEAHQLALEGLFGAWPRAVSQ